MKLFKRKKRKKNKKGAPFCSVVVPAAGSSSRMEGVDKIYAELEGVPVLVRTLIALSECPSVNEIVLVTRKEDVPRAAMLCAQNELAKVTRIVRGGATRAESVMNGLAEISPEATLIAVHDGARPFVSAELVEETVKAALKYNAAIPAVQVKDTVKTVKNGRVTGTPDRSELYAIQTPQIFDADLIKAAMQNVIDKKLAVTDDSMAVEAIGGEVHIVEGSYDNIKLTTPEDMIVGQTIIEKRSGR